MNSEHGLRVAAILSALLARREDGRDAYLDQVCGSDEALRREVKALLADAHAADRFLRTDPLDTDDAQTRTVVAEHQVRERNLAPLSRGQAFGPYRIERLLGRGGMGEVYAAEEQETGRLVALKLLRHTPLDAVDRTRFLREGRLAAAVSHPHVVYIFGSTEIHGTPVIVMELVPGGTLKDRVKAKGVLNSVESVDSILQVIAGLEAAAAVGILHRDIKPSNCFVDSTGQVKVGDFGLSISTLARTESTLTEPGVFLGTPTFASPEQLRGNSLDVRSDIYSVGATLFYLLTGRAPIEDPDLFRLVARITNEPSLSPRILQTSVSKGLADVVLRCLSKDRSMRVSTYAELAAALEPFGSTTVAPAPIHLRLIAGLLDLAIIDAVTSIMCPLVLGPFIAWAVFVKPTPWLRNLPLVVLMTIVVQGMVCLIYFGLSEGIWKASIGKRVAGLKLIGADGAPIRRRTSSARAAMFAGYLIAARTVLARFAAPFSPLLVSPLLPIVIRSTTGVSLTYRFSGGGLYPIALVLLFASVRRQNGFAALNDWFTNSRVATARERERPIVQPFEPPARHVASARRLGPYAVITRSKAAVPLGLVQGYDDVLRRYVWIHRFTPGSAPISPLRRDLDRPTRIRWLAGRRGATESWDSYEDVGGYPVIALGKQPWSRIREWLKQLAPELVAAVDDGTLSELSVDHVWIGGDGRARILDWPATGNGTVEWDDGRPPSGDRQLQTQRFLLQFASATLESQPSRADRYYVPRPIPPLPLSATKFLCALRDSSFGNVRAMAETIQSLGRTDAKLNVRRATHLLVCALCAFLIAGSVVRAAQFRQIVSDRDSLEIQRLQRSVFVLVQYDNWERQNSSTLVVERRKALEVYIGGRLRAAIQRAQSLGTPVFQIEERSRRLNELLQAPAPTEADMARAEMTLQPVIDRYVLSMPATLQRQGRGVYALFFLSVGIALFGIVISSVVWRGGLLLRTMGFAAVTGDGVELSRTRALCRSVIAWLPISAYTLLAAQRAAEHLRVQPSDPLLTLLQPVPLPIVGTPLVALAVVIVASVWAVCRPERGLQDVVTGTWLVPR